LDSREQKTASRLRRKLKSQPNFTGLKKQRLGHSAKRKLISPRQQWHLRCLMKPMEESTMGEKRPDERKEKIKEPPKKDKADRELPPKIDNPETPRIVDPGPV
jgi:hypothetical protein